MPKKQNIRELKKELRGRFERYIAAELASQADVGTEALARGFYGQEQPLLRKIAHVIVLNVLVKWADSILNQSIGRETARNGHPQLVLPMSLKGIEVPGAFSFINGANQLRFVANYKAQWFHLESHDFVLRKHEIEVQRAREQFDDLLDAVRPLMEGTKTILPDALQILRDNEAGAA